MPTDELVDLLDMLVWSGPISDRKRVTAWRTELLARADRDALPVRLAADVPASMAGVESSFGHGSAPESLQASTALLTTLPCFWDN